MESVYGQFREQQEAQQEREAAAERARQESQPLPVGPDKFAAVMNKHLNAAEEELKTEMAKDANQREREALSAEVAQLDERYESLSKNYTQNKKEIGELLAQLQAKNARLDELTPKTRTTFGKFGNQINTTE